MYYRAGNKFQNHRLKPKECFSASSDIGKWTCHQPRRYTFVVGVGMEWKLDKHDNHCYCIYFFIKKCNEVRKYFLSKSLRGVLQFIAENRPKVINIYNLIKFNSPNICQLEVESICIFKKCSLQLSLWNYNDLLFTIFNYVYEILKMITMSSTFMVMHNRT